MSNASIKIIKNTFELIDKEDKRKIFLLIPIYVVLAITDLVGVALLGSVGTLGFKIISGDKQKSRIENIIDQFFKHEYSLTVLTMSLLICSLMVLTIRMISNSYLSYRLVRFQARLQTNVAKNLFNKIITSDISKINYNKYSDYQYSLLTSSSRTISAVIGVVIIIFSDLFTILLMAVFAFYASPFSFLSALIVFSLVILFINGPISKKAKYYGKQNALLHTNITADLLQLFQGIKEIKAYKQTDSIGKIFSNNKLNHSLMNEKSIWLNSLVRYLLELAIILAGSLIMIVLLVTTDTKHTVTVLVVFLAISFRLIPNLQRIQNSILLLKNTEGASSLLFELFRQFDKNKINEIVSTKQFSFIELNKVYFKHAGINNDFILEDINISIEKNTTTAIIGISGAGKTTLVDLICGLYSPTLGEIKFLDQDLHVITNWESGLKISYVSQNPVIFQGSLLMNITLKNQITNLERIRANDILEKLGLSNLLFESDGTTSKQIRSDGTNTSGGERQRISLARAQFFDSDLVVLDEPSSALDTDSKSKVYDFIKNIEGSKTVLIITHDENLIDFCDRTILVKNKTIGFEGKTTDYLNFKKS